MPGDPFLIAVDECNFAALPCCGIGSCAHPGRIEKRCWLEANAKFGLRAKALVAPDGKPAAYIEYIPGEYAWRAVDARAYMVIHCIWNHHKTYQRKGWAGMMIEHCLAEARRVGMKGAAVLTRSGPWLADHRLFLANGFEPVDAAPPDYQLLARKFDAGAANPAFRTGWERKAARFGKGLTIVHCGQCPYIAKFAGEITQTAEEEFGIEPQMVELKSWRDAQNAPTPYAVFSLIYNGRVIADHQVSRTRFRNIIRALTA
jgi:GNAT superfamily N-acetyltransferase